MNDQAWAREIAEKIKKKERAVAGRNREKIPSTAVNGVFDDQSGQICVWTNGFWCGMMWQLYHATKEPLYRQIAESIEIRQDENLMLHWGMDHDSGFRWLPTAVADYRETGSEASKNRGMLAACNLAGRFNPAGRFIRSWNDDGSGEKAGWVIIDCMMNLPLLYWAWEQTKDPRFYHIAVIHADTVEKNHLRGDGSVEHIVELDPMTGEYVRSFGGQGVEAGSSWTRGQAWALYGFTLSYLHTRLPRYLDDAKRVANYFIANIPEDGLIPVDFRQPEECAWKDSSAAAIAACAFLELEKCVGEAEKHLFHHAALRLLKALAEKGCNWSEDCDQLLEWCSGAYHTSRHNVALIFGDYYFIEAIWKLTGEELFIW